MWLPHILEKLEIRVFFPHMLYAFINMYKSLWDIDIEQGFLRGWDSI